MRPRPPRRLARARSALVVLAALLAAGCAATPATVPVAAVVEPAAAPPPAGVAIAQRLRSSAAAVPDVLGHELEAARTALSALHVQVVAFDDDETVSAQHPPPGAAVPLDRVVTLWVGSPPAPPPPQPAPAPSAAAALIPAPAAEPVTAEPTPPAPVSTPASDAPAPTPPRRSPRSLPSAGTGTVLTGLASWYGPGFAGRTTACGGVFDPTELTLATRELRCGTRVRITGPGGTVEATATDWGPAEWTGRRFDLSAATFAAIADPSRGVASVTVEVLTP